MVVEAGLRFMVAVLNGYVSCLLFPSAGEGRDLGGVTLRRARSNDSDDEERSRKRGGQGASSIFLKEKFVYQNPDKSLRTLREALLECQGFST